MALNPENYKIYVRDYGIDEEGLSSILRDVIKEIAIKTRMFKVIVGFDIFDDIDVYDFNSILQINLSERPELTKLTFTNDANSLKELLKSMEEHRTMNIEIKSEDATTIDNSILLEISEIYSEDLNISIFNFFERIVDDLYKFTYKFKGSIDKPSIRAYFIGGIIPDLSSIDEQVESVIKFAIITGVRYYLSSNYNNNPNIQPSITEYQKWQNAINELINIKPYYDSKTYKKVWL